VTNSTFIGNSSSQGGGAIANSSTLTVTNSTFTTNAAGASGGAILNAGPGALTLTNSIVSGNTQLEGAIDNNGGTVTESYNVFYNNVGDDFVDSNSGSLSATDVTGANTMLSALGSYGGSTQSILPLPGSSAICAGTAQPTGYGVTPPTTDQRGNPLDTLCGSGAMDAGAAQTSYSLVFATQPSSSQASGQTITASSAPGFPAVQLEDNGVAINLPGASLSMALSQGTLSGSTSAATNASGLATFSSLTPTSTTTQSSDSLTASALDYGTTNITVASASFSLSPASTLAVLPSSIPDGRIGVAFSQQFTASGGIGNDSFTYDGALPSGLSLSSAGLLTGTPTQSGSFSIKVTGNDSSYNTASQSYTLSIDAPAIALSSNALAAGTYGSVYSAAISASGGTAPYSYALASGSSLPAGLTLNAATGVISGTPSAATTGQSFSIVATDSSTGAGPYSATGNYQLSIGKAGLTVTANSSNIVYGQTVPAFTASYAGFINGDNSSTAFTGAPLLTTSPASPVNAGTYPVTAATGTLSSTNYTFSFVSGALTVNAAPLTITASAVTEPYGTLPAIGTVTSGFTSSGLKGSDAIASVTMATTDTTTTAAGASGVTVTPSAAVFGAGSASNYTITYQSGAVTVNPATNASVSVSNIPASATYGGSFLATYSYTGNGTPTESITSSTPTICTVSGNTVSFIAAGACSLTAQAAATANYAAVTGTAQSFTVNAAPLTITASAVTEPYGALPATGAVTSGFTSSGLKGSDAIALVTMATTDTTTTAAGASGVTVTPSAAVFGAGSASNYTITYQSGAVTVNPNATTTTLSTPTPISVLSNTVTLTASVNASYGVPTGSVNFYDGSTLLGAAGVNTNGVAAYSTTSLATGTHSITATYSGDTNDSASATSSALSETVVDFTIANSGSTSQTVMPGAAATYTYNFGISSGATLPVAATVTLSGLPSGATATLTGAGWTQLSSDIWQLPANTPVGTVTLSITTPGTTASNQTDSGFGRGMAPIALGLLLLPFAGRLRRAGKRLGHRGALLLLLVAGLLTTLGISGCGGPFFPQSQQSYNVTVCVVAGSLTHTSNMTLTVE
jgi:hypothetical protein